MSKRKVKVLVTGGRSFIGSHLVDGLVKKGYNVANISRSNNGRPINEKSKNYFADLTGRKKLELIFKSERPDFVFHLAALSNPNLSFNEPHDYLINNITSTINILELSKKYNIKKVIFASSCAVYGKGKAPSTEDQQLMPETPYSLSKYISEALMIRYYKLYSLPTISFRFFMFTAQT